MCAASKCSEMVKRDKAEPLYLRDYERKQLLERGAMAGVSDSEEEEERTRKVRRRRRGGSYIGGWEGGGGRGGVGWSRWRLGAGGGRQQRKGG